jgi:uncharacterized protein
VTALLSALAGFALLLQGVTLPSPPRGFSATEADMVVDQARVLSPDAVARMNRAIFAVKAASGGEIVVVTMPDIGGRDVGDIALQIGRDWKVGSNASIGDRSRNAAVVVLLVPKETASDGRGQISIQTGQGAEGFITDAVAGDIRRAAIPYLQAQDYSSATELITQRLALRYASEFGFSLDSGVVDSRFIQRRSTGRSVQPSSAMMLFVVVIILMLLMSSASRGGRRGCLYALLAEGMSSGHRHRGGWGGGGFGGGSWGGGGGGGFGGFGGGGGFSGGGSSGSW